MAGIWRWPSATSQCELYDFNNATGSVSNYLLLASHDYTYGIEFSPDNSKLYTTYSLAGEITQYNLLAGSPTAIVNSATRIVSAERLGNLVLGPDNKIYVVSYGNSFLNVIQNPNAAGAACDYRRQAVPLAGKLGLNGLPNFANIYAPVYTRSFTSGTGCAGTAIAFTGAVQPATSSAVATWNFGDPASGSANVATGLAPTHTYATAGTYQVTLTVAIPGLATPLSTTQAVVVAPAPRVSLGADTLVCPNAVWTLRVGPQPAGSLYRWQDGSTAPTYLAHGPGQYSVEVRASATGCPATATRLAGAISCPVFIPNIITPNGDLENEFFELKGLTASEWHLRIFDRWGRQVYDKARYDNQWNASGQANGMYYYMLSNAATGERYRGWVEVQRGS